MNIRLAPFAVHANARGASTLDAIMRLGHPESMKWLLPGILLFATAFVPARASEEPYFLDPVGNPFPLLRGGWSLSVPYQYMEPRGSTRIEATLDELEGIDVDLANVIARAAGYAILYTFRPLRQHLAELASGAADIAAGIVQPATASAAIRYSIPYRRSAFLLCVRRGELARFPFDDAAGLVHTFSESALRLGVVAGAAFGHAELDAYLADPVHRLRVVEARNEFENIRNLLAGEVDAVLLDHLAAASTVWRGGWRNRVEPHALQLSADVRFAFSAATVDPDTLRRFDDAIRALDAQGMLRRIEARHRLPELFGRILDTRWFLALDIIGTVAFALSGVLIAMRERYSVFGAFVLAALPAVGGGVVRDVLVDRVPIAIMASPLYLVIVVSTVLGGYLLLRAGRWVRRYAWTARCVEAAQRHPALRNLYEVSDAVGLAAFTLTGVAVAISYRADPLWLWAPLLAVFTAAGGGILRDLVRQAGRIGSLTTVFYAEIPLLWGFLLTLFLESAVRLQWFGGIRDPYVLATAIGLTLLGAFATRMLAVIYKRESPALA